MLNNLNEVTASSGHSGFVINPASQELVTSTASTLQFYNVHKDMHMREFNIAPRNKIIADKFFIEFSVVMVIKILLVYPSSVNNN